jgi:hypothetical protein
MGFPRLRTRFAALVLLFASPGFAGLAVDAAHPCPEKAPWTVDASGQDGPGHHHDQAPTEKHDCKCVGSCQTAIAASIDVQDAVAYLAPAEASSPALFHFQLAPLGRPQDRLPPATAPPLV